MTNDDKALADALQEGKEIGVSVVEKQLPFVKDANKIRPNDRCSCGSGKKYKVCCGNK